MANDLVANMVLNDAGFTAGITKAERNLNSLGGTARNTASKINLMQGLAGTFGPFTQGAADFASQLGTRGLGGALTAAANNIGVMGAAFGPWGIAISSAAGLAAQGLGAYLEATDKSKKSTKDLHATTVDFFNDVAARSKSIQDALKSPLDKIERAERLRSDKLSGFGGASSQSLDQRAQGEMTDRNVLLEQQKRRRLAFQQAVDPTLQRFLGQNSEQLGFVSETGIQKDALQRLQQLFPKNPLPGQVGLRDFQESLFGTKDLDTQLKKSKDLAGLVNETNAVTEEIKQRNEVINTLIDAANDKRKKENAESDSKAKSAKPDLPAMFDNAPWHQRLPEPLKGPSENLASIAVKGSQDASRIINQAIHGRDTAGDETAKNTQVMAGESTQQTELLKNISRGATGQSVQVVSFA